jgi:hypothetical protein
MLLSMLSLDKVPSSASAAYDRICRPGSRTRQAQRFSTTRRSSLAVATGEFRGCSRSAGVEAEITRRLGDLQSGNQTTLTPSAMSIPGPRTAFCGSGHL